MLTCGQIVQIDEPLLPQWRTDLVEQTELQQAGLLQRQLEVSDDDTLCHFRGRRRVVLRPCLGQTVNAAGAHLNEDAGPPEDGLSWWTRCKGSGAKVGLEANLPIRSVAASDRLDLSPQQQHPTGSETRKCRLRAEHVADGDDVGGLIEPNGLHYVNTKADMFCMNSRHGSATQPRLESRRSMLMRPGSSLLDAAGFRKTETQLFWCPTEKDYRAKQKVGLSGFITRSPKKLAFGKHIPQNTASCVYTWQNGQ
ncbi:unnamed protein product [Protopolystoma xenopodis]|uniref:Uncharacterized protein n=1 Tax=Protopolystoma xenopodis TaxID=117903 RepID=A0A3S5A3S1_9PLAT|nr:unnamed protein product [Protopolystoma xenopodis]